MINAFKRIASFKEEDDDDDTIWFQLSYYLIIQFNSLASELNPVREEFDIWILLFKYLFLIRKKHLAIFKENGKYFICNVKGKYIEFLMDREDNFFLLPSHMHRSNKFQTKDTLAPQFQWG